MLLLLLACQSPSETPPRAPTEPVVAPLLEVAPPGARLDTYTEMWADRVAVRHASDGQGRFERLGDEAVAAGTVHTLRLRFTAGPDGVAPGGALTFLPEPFWGWSPPQTDAAEAPGFVEVTAPAGVQLVPRAVQGQLVLEVGETPLAPGAVVELAYTGRVDRFAEPESGLYLAVDGDGDGVRQWVKPAPSVRVLAGPAAQLVATLPTTAPVGGTVRLTVAALDGAANAGATGVASVTLQLPEGWTGPEAVALTDGVGEATLTAGIEGIGRVVVQAGDLRGWTAPVLVRDGAPRILWADLQIHTGRSDGTGTPEAAYRYARDVAGLDAAAVTDHDRFGMRFLDAEPALWAEAQQAADAATRDGFVAFPAYEWTNWVFGHRHVLYVGEPGPVFSSLDPATDTPQELWSALRPYDAISIAHHPGGGPVPIDWSIRPDPQLEPVVEITSVHGQSESLGLPQAIYDAHASGFVEGVVQDGAVLGFIGSTDGHDGHPGLAHLVGEGRGGLAALVDAEPTRAGVAEALRARRVYATNGVRTFLRFDAGGKPMGSVLPAGPSTLELRVIATSDLVGVELVGKDGPVGRLPASGPVVHHRWEVEGAAGELFYVRVVQVDGGLVWSSPIWFR